MADGKNRQENHMVLTGLRRIALLFLLCFFCVPMSVSAVENAPADNKTEGKKVVPEIINTINAFTAEKIEASRTEMKERLEKAQKAFYEAYGPKNISGTFYYASGDDYDFKTTFDYRDEFFMRDARIYNHELGEMSLCYAMSAFHSNTARTSEQQSRNAVALLEKAEFRGIETNDCFKTEPTAESMGVIAGYKNVYTEDEKYTLIAVTTRGAGYRSEWASNLMMGASGRHKGFGEAADIVESFLTEYVSSHKDLFLPKVKLWMTGYSRGGAAINLASGDLTVAGSLCDIKLEPEDIYVYCFEAPQGESAENITREAAASLRNIHNINNPDDAVPRVAFEKWGFFRYGVDEDIIPQYEAELYPGLKDVYRELRTTETVKSFLMVEDGESELNEYYLPDTFVAQKFKMDIDIDTDFVMKDTEIIGIPIRVPSIKFNTFSIKALQPDDKKFSQLLDEVVDALAIGFESREVYAEYMEPVICRLITELFSAENREADWDNAFSLLSDKIKANILEVAELVFLQETEELASLLTEYFFEAAEEAGIHITQDDSVRNGTSQAVECVFEAVLYSLFDGNIGNIVSLVENFGLISNNHYPELCLSWMRYLE